MIKLVGKKPKVVVWEKSFLHVRRIRRKVVRYVILYARMDTMELDLYAGKNVQRAGVTMELSAKNQRNTEEELVTFRKKLA